MRIMGVGYKVFCERGIEGRYVCIGSINLVLIEGSMPYYI